MKTNAIVRIVIWSLIIVTLTAVLVFFLGRETHFFRDIIIASSPLGVEEAQPTESDDIIYYRKIQEPITATVLEDMNLRKTPSPKSEAIALLPAGTVLEILRTENVDGRLWGYTSEPTPGWLVMDYVKFETSISGSDTPAFTSPADSSEPLPSSAYPSDVTPIWIPSNEVRDISIDWAAGNITVYLVENSDKILFYEEGGNPDRPMNSTHKEGKLSIEFCDEQFFGIGIGSSLSKDLTIQIPKGTALEELEINAASAKLHVKDVPVQEVNLDTASGTADFVNCTVDTMDVDTASGNISFTGSLNNLDCDAASADFEAVLTNVPRSIEMDSASGSLKLTLPENAGFSVNVDGLSSRFTSDFETTMQNGRFVHGDGYCRIDMDAMSGKVSIKKAN